MQIMNVSKLDDDNIDRSAKISNSVQEIPRKLGLTKNESKVYAYLNRNGSTKAKTIALNQKIPRR